MPIAASKLQRWIDLVAALLIRRYPAPFDELAADMPAYSGQKKADASLMRMFERDKDELRTFGIPIETVTNDQAETLGYRLSSKDFYLPYLALAEMGRPVSKPKRVDKYGYQALSTLTFEPDELAALSSTIARVVAKSDSYRTNGVYGYSETSAKALAYRIATDTPIFRPNAWD